MENYIATKWIEDGTKRIFVPWNFNFYIEYDVETERTEVILPIQEEWSRNNLYCDVLKYNNYAIFIPRHAQHFMIVDLIKKETIYIEIPKREKLKYQYGYFSKGIICEKYVYAIGLFFPGIIRIDLDSFEILILDEWYMELQKSVTITTNALMHSVVDKDDKIYALTANGNYIFCYELKTLSYEFIKITKNEDLRCVGLCFDGKFFWMIDNNQMKVIKWSEERREIIEVFPLMDNGDYDYSTYLNEEVFFMSEKGAPIVVVHTGDGTVKEIWKDEKEKVGFYIKDVSYYDNQVAVVDASERAMFILDSEKQRTSCVEWKSDEKQIMENILENQAVVLNESSIGLGTFINYLCK